MKNSIYYEDNLGFIKLPNCKPRQVFINEIGAYYLKRSQGKIVEVYIKR